MPLLRLTPLLLRIAVSLALLFAIAWAAAALWIDGPESRVLAGMLAGVVVVSALAAALVRPRWQAAAAVFVLFAIVLAWWLTLVPSNDRDWQPDVAHVPTATIEGSHLTIRNLRNFEYRDENDFIERWDTRTYDLDTLVGVDVFISFWGPTLYGHTIVSWEFSDGSHLAVSIETRKEVGEEYSAILGFFRQFELYYVVADERDLIGVRTNHRGELVRRYRLRTPPEVARAILVDYFEEINRLAEQPHWYNAMTQNCTTTIRRHVQHVSPTNPFNWRILVNGTLDELGYMRGSIDNSLPFEEVRRRADITERAKAAGSSADFSARIRMVAPES
jgi:hypothetical protein